MTTFAAPIPPAWLADAVCASVDPAIFFPKAGSSGAPAKRICASCEVRVACKEWALEDSDLVGIWGGTTERDRAAIRGRTCRFDDCATPLPKDAHRSTRYCGPECADQARIARQRRHDKRRKAERAAS